MSTIKERLVKTSTVDDSSFEIIRLRSQPKLSPLGMVVTPTLNQFLRARSKHYDVIHVHEYRTYQNIVVQKLAGRLELPYVLQAHGSVPRIGLAIRKLLFDQFFGYNILKKASIAIAVSPAEVYDYCRFGLPQDRVRVVPNAINLSEFQNLPPRGVLRGKLSLGPSEQMILYLGRLDPIKGIDLLISAFQSVLVKHNNAHLVIAGPDRNYRPVLRRMAKNLGVDHRVHFLPALFSREKLQAMVDADVFVLPSLYEVFGLVILEAQACMTPVVASRVGGIRSIIKDNSTGLMFERGNPDDLAEKVGTILEDREHSLEFARRARKHLEEYYSIQKTVDRLEGIYARL